MDKVFFANSGAEANEGAIKAARKYSKDKYGENRFTIITLENSFHGRTMATLSATGQDFFHQHFSPFVNGFAHMPANDISALESHLTPDVGAVMVELIQGEGGVNPLKEEYLSALQKACKEKDILLIVDEVQTGIGRTGTLLASQQTCLQPDITTLAKGLGGGLPLAAILFSDTCSHVLGKSDHATTYGGNPVCCAGALVVLNRLNNEFLSQIKENGNYLQQQLLSLPGVEAVSGQGLMLGIQFKEPITATMVAEKSLENGLLCLTAKTKLRLLPPLIITKDEIDTGIKILKNVLEELQ